MASVTGRVAASSTLPLGRYDADARRRFIARTPRAAPAVPE
ncbi:MULTISPECIES: hypothetical protein [Streptomyces]|nr:hypothetical protein [Streptomyces sp. CL12-4]